MTSIQFSRASHQQELQQWPSGQAPQRLRLSCDACAAAKVRCGRERPRCERCDESNLDCVYGPSLKNGKPGKRKKRSDAHSRKQSLSSASAPSPQAQFVSPIDRTYYSDLHQSYSDVLQHLGNSNNASTYPRNWNGINAVSGNNFSVPPPGSSFPPLGSPFWPDRVTYGDNGSGSLTTLQDLYTTPGPVDTSTSMLSDFDFSHQFVNLDPSNSTSLHANSTSLSAPGGRDSIFHKRPNSTTANDCHAIATSTLASLHPRPRSSANNNNECPSSLYSSSPSALSTSGLTIQTLDDILRSNREAICNVFELLTCSCAESPNMAMLYASIIVKVLYWHQVAAGPKKPSSRSMPNSEGLLRPVDLSADITLRKCPCSSSTPFISSEPIKIGSYVPDEEDQEPIRRLFLLSNLKKTGRVIEAFATVGGGVDTGTSRLYALLTSWLRLELSKVIKEVGNGAKASVIP